MPSAPAERLRLLLSACRLAATAPGDPLSRHGWARLSGGPHPSVEPQTPLPRPPTIRTMNRMMASISRMSPTHSRNCRACVNPPTSNRMIATTAMMIRRVLLTYVLPCLLVETPALPVTVRTRSGVGLMLGLQTGARIAPFSMATGARIELAGKQGQPAADRTRREGTYGPDPPRAPGAPWVGGEQGGALRDPGRRLAPGRGLLRPGLRMECRPVGRRPVLADDDRRAAGD